MKYFFTILIPLLASFGAAFQVLNPSSTATLIDVEV